MADRNQDSYYMVYQAGAAVNVVIADHPVFLHSIVIGKDDAGGIIEISDHATDGDGNVVLYIADPVVGTILIDAMFNVGICCDITTQTHITFIGK